jgi:glyoxylase-like metal-dependent hydrolase (beta-lactamase superfamily II)
LVNGATSAKGSGHLTAQPDGELQRQAWRDRLLPPVEQVRPGLWSIPVPWPDSGLRYTLAYLLQTRAGLALIDTGWPTEAAWTALRDGVRKAGHDLAEVGYVLVTHAHPDHLGMAQRVREASGARVGMHPAEAATLRSADRSAWRERVGDWLLSRGTDRRTDRGPEGRSGGGQQAARE